MTNPTLKQALVDAFAANPESLVTPEEEADIALQVLSEWEPTDRELTHPGTVRASMDVEEIFTHQDKPGVYDKWCKRTDRIRHVFKAALSAACKEDV